MSRCVLYSILAACCAGLATNQGAAGQAPDAMFGTVVVADRHDALAPAGSAQPLVQVQAGDVIDVNARARRRFWPYIGGAYAAAAVTAVGWGLLYKRTTTVCASPLVSGDCPTNAVVERRMSYPHRTAGLITGGAIAVAGIIHWSLFDRGRDEPALDGARQEMNVNAGIVGTSWDGTRFWIDVLRLSF